IIDRLRNGNARGVKVFCLNDADSTSENVAAQDAIVRRYLVTRYPRAGAWEDSKKSAQPAVSMSVDLTREDSFIADLQRVGPDEAGTAYRRASLDGNRVAGRKLFRLLNLQERSTEAAAAARHGGWADEVVALRQIDALSKSVSTSELAPK